APVTVVAFSPDGRTLLGGDESGTARLWDRATGKPLGAPMRQDHEIGRAAFAPDGAAVITGSGLALTASLWGAAAGVKRGTTLWHRTTRKCWATSPEGRAARTGGADKGARLWELGRSLSRPADQNPDQKSRTVPDSPLGPRLPIYLLHNIVAYSADR